MEFKMEEKGYELEKLSKRFSKIKNMKDKLVVSDSQFVDLDNKLPPSNMLSETGKDAIHESMYRSIRINSEIDTNNVDDEIKETALDGIIMRYVRDFIDKTLFG